MGSKQSSVSSLIDSCQSISVDDDKPQEDDPMEILGEFMQLVTKNTLEVLL